MKNGLQDIVGQTIPAVVVAQSERMPRQQVFLVFSDGSRFEFWGSSFSCAGGLDDGGETEATKYAEKGGARVTAVYPTTERE